jgi:hypothetical protein
MAGGETMQTFINDALTVLIVCLIIAAVTIGLVVLRPWKRRHRHRRRHSRRPKIDLLRAEAAEPAPKTDA